VTDTKKVSTVMSVKKFFGLTTAEMKAEFSPLSPADKLDFCDMLPAVGIVPTDRDRYAKAAASA